MTRRLERPFPWLCAAALAALAAAWGPRVPGGAAPTLRVLVFDASASAGASLPSPASLRGLGAGLSRSDRIAVVLFADGAHAVIEPVASGALPAVVPDRRPPPHASDLAAGLRVAAALRGDLAGPFRREVVVVTDGRSTSPRADVASAAGALREAGCAAFSVRPASGPGLGSRATHVVGPGRVALGEPFALEVRGVAAEGGCTVRLLRDSRGVEERSVARAGPFRLLFTRIEDGVGVGVYRAVVAGGEGLPAPSARVVVARRGAVLVLGGAAQRAELVTALGGEVGFAPAAQPSAWLPLLDAHDAVVVDGVPARELDGTALDALSRWVSGGGGLLLLGGPTAFGSGGWPGHALERLSPLLSRPPGEEGLFLYLALDGSGSMGHPWPGAGDDSGVLRDATARSAVETLVRGAAGDTVLALRRFSGGLLPPAPRPLTLDARGKDEAVRVVQAFPEPGGATALVPPLAEAGTLLAGRGERRKAVVLVSDAQTEESASDVRAAAERLGGASVTLVLPGPEDAAGGASVRSALRDVGVAVRVATRSGDLAGVLRDVEERARVEELTRESRELVAVDPAWGTRDLPRRARRVNAAWPAPQATVLVTTGEREPVVAVWERGLGRVAAVAARPGDPDWIAGDGAAGLVRGALSAVERRAALGARVELEGRTLRVLAPGATPPAAARLVYADGSTSDVALRTGADGLRVAEVPARGPSRERPTLVRLLDGRGAVLTAAGLDTPAPAEYCRPEHADLVSVAGLARGPDPPGDSSLRPWLALGAVLFVLAGAAAELFARRRGGDIA